MIEKTFTCPGLTMPQPEGAPYEGYVACYRAGHECTTEVVTNKDEHGVSTKVRCSCCGDGHASMFMPHSMIDEYAENLIPVRYRGVASSPSPEPFCADVAPECGGNIRTEVSGWGTWNIWLGIESYVDGHDQTAMGPGDALKVAWCLVRAAAVCAWKRARSDR